VASGVWAFCLILTLKNRSGLLLRLAVLNRMTALQVDRKGLLRALI
jgi:hypothetical protein